MCKNGSRGGEEEGKHPESPHTHDYELPKCSVYMSRSDLILPLKLNFSAATNIALAADLFSSYSPCSSRACKPNHIAHCGFYYLPTGC